MISGGAAPWALNPPGYVPDELTPCRSIYSAPPCRCPAGRNWAGADRSRPFSTRFASVHRFCIASLWEDPECRPEELENGLDWCRHDKGGQRKTGKIKSCD